MVTLYSTNGCVGCKMSKRVLTERGVTFREISLEEEPDALELVRSLGHMQAPVLVTEDDHWSGFQPDRLNSIPV